MTAAEGRVLILDDDPLVGAVIVAHTHAAGYEARFTECPREFFELHESWKPDWVILDLVMEQMDGLEVLARLAKMGSAVPVIISSGMGSRVMDAARRYADAHGITIAGLLSKPFTRVDLSALLAVVPKPDDREHRALRAEPGPWWTPQHFVEVFDDALERNEIEVAYQPKFRCADGAVVGYEALARWTHRDHGVLSPANFVAFAERAGVVNRLTDLVLALSLAWFAVHRNPGEHLSVNISAAELSDPDLDQRLLNACQLAGVGCDEVVLELTETSAMDDPVLSLQLLTRLRLQGFRVSLDDFGTGYSSMLQLARLPFSEVKVDRSFVINAHDSEESVIVIRSIIDLAHALGMECTAEGVEDAKVLGLLRDMGCDFAQGYHLGRPMLPTGFEQWQQARA